MDTPHADAAREHLAAVKVLKPLVDELRADTTAPDRAQRIEAASAEMRLGLKLALIEVGLDIGDAVRALGGASPAVAPGGEVGGSTVPERGGLSSVRDEAAMAEYLARPGGAGPAALGLRQQLLKGRS